jgi:hypothetical protein
MFRAYKADNTGSPCGDVLCFEKFGQIIVAHFGWLGACTNVLPVPSTLRTSLGERGKNYARNSSGRLD